MNKEIKNFIKRELNEKEREIEKEKRKEDKSSQRLWKIKLNG